MGGNKFGWIGLSSKWAGGILLGSPQGNMHSHCHQMITQQWPKAPLELLGVGVLGCIPPPVGASGHRLCQHVIALVLRLVHGPLHRDACAQCHGLAAVVIVLGFHGAAMQSVAGARKAAQRPLRWLQWLHQRCTRDRWRGHKHGPEEGGACPRWGTRDQTLIALGLVRGQPSCPSPQQPRETPDGQRR